MVYVNEGGQYKPKEDKKYPPGTVFYNRTEMPEIVNLNVQIVVSHPLSNTQVWKNLEIPVKIKDSYLYTTGTYVEWKPEDLKDSEQVTFVPFPVPTLVHPVPTDDGRQRIVMDVNNLKQELIVGIPNTVPEMFYHAYKNCLDEWRANEGFKRCGPKNSPWKGMEKMGKGWYYDPSAHSFGMDIDGRYLQAGMEYEEISPGFLRPTGRSAPIGLKIVKKPKRDARGRFVKNTGDD